LVNHSTIQPVERRKGSLFALPLVSTVPPVHLRRDAFERPEGERVTTKIANRVHHVAILVHSIDASVDFYRDQFNFSLASDERLPELGVRLAFLDAGGTFLQLVEPITDGPLKQDLERIGEGLHHICFAVPDIELAIAQLSPGQSVSVNTGTRGRTAFLPVGPNGVRTELIETAPSQPREGVS
jgi:methylmalonyl-CoA/ethylmalonyl-CoA epimerase